MARDRRDLRPVQPEVGKVRSMAFTPGRGAVKRPTDRLVADGLGGGTSITSQPVITGANPDSDEATRLNVAASGMATPGAGGQAITGQLVQR
jgi:hypothetical protein